ncbi:DUF3626 domain-containing protein [Trinickia acidisoli]|uniref:DUF3626 domain-containing protein n=1 Tax=Trinickia acidisoli TaxID=2767482 RepID=UPI001A8DED9E|nr:DUF3626 domain-containing protein [Trinickia acidisoli]
MQVDEFEAEAALARLARNETLGLLDLARSGRDLKERAFRRFLAICRPAGSAAQARRFFESNMLGILKDGRLTINFNANTWFGNGKEPMRVLNLFDRVHGPAENAKTAKDRWYRNDVEMEFGDYAGHARNTAHARNVKDARRLVARYGATQIDRVGLPTSHHFTSMVRPRYGALDFAYCLGGGAGGNGYGRSFAIIKEHVKHASSYLYTDSFKVNADLAARREEYGGKIVTLHDAMATYLQLEKILLYCTPQMLKQIYAYASGKRARGSSFCLPPDTTGVKVNYIEFQAHTDIRFDRDIAAMTISRSEIPQTFLGLPWHSAERHIREFAQKNRIRVSFFA